MARWSDPDEGLTQDRFKVWSAGDDLYSRAELEENWDTLDAMIGRPVDGVTVWPPLDERGIGKGMWLYFQQLMAERPPLGDIKWVWAPTDAALAAVIPVQQDAGWDVANGQTIASGDHDFGDLDPALSGQNVTLVNLVDHYVIGVAEDSTVGTEGGITTNNGSNVGTQGSATISIDVDIASHTHTVPSHTHSVPSHRHGMNHVHTVSAGAYTGHDMSVARFGIVYNLKASAIDDTRSYDGFLGETPGGFTHPVPHALHRHNLYSDDTTPPTVSQPMRSGSANVSTDLGGSGASGSWSGTTGSGGTISETYEVDSKPLSAGMVPFVKVRYASGI